MPMMLGSFLYRKQLHGAASEQQVREAYGQNYERLVAAEIRSYEFLLFE